MTQLSGHNSALAAYQPPFDSLAAPIEHESVRETTMPSLVAVAVAIYMVSVITLSTASEATSWIPQVVGAVVGVMWLVVGVVVKGQPIIWSSPVTSFILFTLWGMTGILVTIDVDFFWGIELTGLKVMAMAWIALQCVRTRKDFLFCCLLIGASSILIMLLGKDTIMHALEYTGGREKATARASGTLLSNSNDLGQFGVLVCITSGTCLLGYKSVIMKLVSLAPMVVALYLVAASGSRTAMVGLAAAVVGVYWYHFREAGKGSLIRKVFMILLAVGVMGGSVYFLIRSPFFFRLAAVFSSSDAMQDEPRYQYFMRALKAMSENPLFGLGMGGFAANRLGVDEFGMGHYSHSSVSETLSCTGLPGFFLFFGGRYVFYKLLKRVRNLPLPPQDFATVNLIMAYFWALVTFDIVSVTLQHRLMWPLIGACGGYLWYLNRQYGRDSVSATA